MFARLTADPDLIRAFGSASAGHAADLQAVAARLTALNLGSAPMFGPVGARFQSALARAVEREVGAVADLSGALAAANPAASGTAQAYEDTDAAVGLRLTGAW